MFSNEVPNDLFVKCPIDFTYFEDMGEPWSHYMDLKTDGSFIPSANTPIYPSLPNQALFDEIVPDESSQWSDGSAKARSDTSSVTSQQGSPMPDSQNWTTSQNFADQRDQRVYLVNEKLVLLDNQDGKKPQMMLLPPKRPSDSGLQLRDLLQVKRSRIGSTTESETERESRESLLHRRHLSAEYRYRESINSKLNELKSLIDGSNSTLSKKQVLNNAILYIKKLQKRHKKLMTENEVLRNAQKYGQPLNNPGLEKQLQALLENKCQ